MPIKDKSLYPRCWKEISLFIRFYRAGNHCERCGVPNHTSHPHTGSRVVLTVAHLDHNPRNNYLSNLAALCQRCHNRHDFPIRVKHAKATRREKRYKYQLVLF